MCRTFLGMVLAALLGVCPTEAAAATVATGYFTVPTAADSVSVFDDVTFDVFGTPVDFGTAMQELDMSFAVTWTGPYGGVLTASATSSPMGAFVADFSGNYICTMVNCAGGAASFIGTMSNVTGTAVAGLPPDLVYVFDGTVAYGELWNGPVALNAFQPTATPASPPGCTGTECAVPVTIPPTTITNSATGQEVPVSASLTFPAVTASGVTTVTGVSNIAAAVPANFTFGTGATFLDITTTAIVDTSGGPILVCVDYTIASDVSDPSVLRLMHAEGGTWVDVTTSVDTVTHTICGQVTSLSPFGVGIFAPSTTTTTFPNGTTTTTTLPPFTDQPISGRKLILKRAASGKEKAVFVSKDPAFLFPVFSSGNDPMAVGATVDLLSANEGAASFDLPSGNWSVNSAGTVYKFLNKTAPDATSAVKVAVIKQGKVLKVVTKAAGLPLAGPQGSVDIRIQTGLLRNCARFGAGTIVKDEAGRFIAKNASASGLADCSDASLLGSASGAFVDLD